MRSTGRARHAALDAQGPAHRLGPPVRRDPPQARPGRGARPAPLRHRRHDPHLQGIAAAVAPFVGGSIHRIVPSSFSPHAVTLLDHAGWRIGAKLAAPPDITPIPPPPKAPEPNPVEDL
jgi:hypothetical protein